MRTSGPAPRARYLRLSVTGSCDLRCAYCAPPESAGPCGPPLRDAELLRAVRLLVRRGVVKIRLTGGEPQRFDRLLAVAEEFRAARAPPSAATEPDPDVVEELRALGYLR